MITEDTENMTELSLAIKSNISSFLLSPDQSSLCRSPPCPVKLHNAEIVRRYPGDTWLSLSHRLEEFNCWELHVDQNGTASV